MLERIEKYLEETTLIPALAGYEEKMAAYLRREFESCGLPVTIDTLGNCMARVDGTDPNAPVITVFAHMDSLGFVVRYIEEDGFIRIERLGGIPEKVLKRARTILTELESQSDRPRRESAPQEQMTLGNAREEEVLDALRRSHPDALTPLEAMQLLYELKKKLE